MKKILSMIAASSLAVQPAFAQHVTSQSGAFQQNEASIGIGLTIPFGGSTKQSEPARVDLRWSRDVISADGSRLSVQTGRNFQSSIGVALNRGWDNQLLLNGRALPKADGRQGISKGGKIALIVVGVGALAFGGLVIAQQLQGPTD
jgi:hypothetical protein